MVVGGPISDRKGVNLPGTVLALSPLTEKDRRDLAFGLDLGVDWVALSFVQTPSDVMEARGLIAGRAGLIAKIEKPSALDHIEDIIRIADGVMVARGDLGVELPPEDVPGRQKELVRACRRAVKPVIVATQMLESMVSAPSPTRAEASDVATAVYDGADAVMLSAESAAGQYPIEAVSIMDRIIRRTEQHRLYRSLVRASEPEVEDSPPHAVAAAAATLADAIEAAAIVAFTSSGTTAARIARKRPNVPILAATSDTAVSRRLSLYGAPIRCSARRSTPTRRWSTAPPRSPPRKGSRRPRTWWWRWPASRSAGRGRPTTCGWWSWDGRRAGCRRASSLDRVQTVSDTGAKPLRSSPPSTTSS